MGRGGLVRLALALPIVSIFVVDLLALTRTNATTVTVNEALRRFQQAPWGDTTVAAGLPTAMPAATTAPTTTARSTTTRRPSPSTSATTVAAATTRSRPSEASSAGAATSATAAHRPAPGVYRYVTDGSESVSILGAERRYPTETTRTVRHGAGCAWTFRVILLEEHQEEHTACSRPGALDLTSSTNDVRWFGLATTTTLVCDPAIRHVDLAAGVGSTNAFLCREGADSTFSGTSSVVGEETVNVAGQTRRAWRLSVTGSFEGKTRGTVTVTELIDQETWMTLFEQRRNDLRQQSLVGDIAYRQDVTLRLRSLTPSR